MATLNQWAYNIRNIARAGLGNSDDERLQISMIKFWIKGHRAAAVYRATEAGKAIDPQLVQDLGVLKLEEVDKADSSCPAVEWGCTIKKVEIPKLLDLPDNRAMSFIGLIDKQTPIIMDHADTHIFKSRAKFGNILNRAYLIGNTLYVTGPESACLEYINVRGVFEDPTEVKNFPKEDCDEPVCFDDRKDEYPIPMRLYDEITRSILTTELQLTLQTVNDELNNARQDNQKIQ